MLSETQARAMKAVQEHAEHQLELGWRQMIWAEFGDRTTPENNLTPAHRQRIELAVAGVRRVLPLWQKRYPDSDIPNVALSAIDEIVKDEEADHSETFDQLWGAAMHLSVEDPSVEVAVGFAAVQALGTAIYDEFFNAEELDPELEDGDDPETHDSAYWAAVAAANGQPANPESSPEQRLEFWKWWLTDAIESARKAG
jgi:hypothetical protein